MLKNSLTVLMRRPLMACCILLIAFTGVFTAFEYVRGRRFLSSVDRYVQSSVVVNLVDSIDLVEMSLGSDKCNISVDILVKSEHGEASNAVQYRRVEEVGERAVLASPAPRFNSMMYFIPHVSEAMRRSDQLDGALAGIKNVTRQDIYTEYCSELVEVLSGIYFVGPLATGQGVHALHVSQIEIFKQDAKDAKKDLSVMNPPANVVSLHIQLIEMMDDLQLKLTADYTDTAQFSRGIEQAATELDATLLDLGDRAKGSASQLYLLEIFRDELFL